MAPPKKGAVETESTVSRTTRSSRTMSPRSRSKTPTKPATSRSRSRSAGRSATTTTTASSSSRTSRSPGRKAVSPTAPSPTKKTPGNSPTKRSPAAKSPGRTPAKSPGRTPASKSPGRAPAKVTRLKSPGSPKSPAAKSPGRPRSPAAKSPGRPRSPAAKSPGRPKSPAAKSPARRTPAAAKTTRATSKSPSRTPTQRRKSVSPTREKDTSSQRAAPSRIPTSSTSATTLEERSPASDRSSLATPLAFTVSQPVVNLGSTNSITRRIVSTGTSTEESPQVYSAQTQRSSARISTMRSSAPASSKSPLLGTYSLEDEGEAPPMKSHAPAVEGKSRWRFIPQLPRVTLRFGLGATLGALFWFFLVPSLAVVIYLVCQKESCTVLKVPPLSRNVNSYFHWKLYALYAAFLVLQAVLQALPLGRRVQGFPSKALKQRVAYDYRLNGWVNLLGTVALFGALTYYRFPMVIPYRYILPLLVTTVVFAPVLSLLLYIKGRFAPWHHRFPPGNTGNVLNDYVKGRELSPRIGQTFDLAALCFRCGLLTWVVLLGSMAFQEYTTQGCFDYGFATSAVCQFLYICMVFFDEEYFLSSAFVTDDGLGYVAVAGNLVLMPFVSALPAKFLLEQRPRTLPWYCLAGIGLLFLIGLGAMHFAHKRKYQLKRNWPDPTSRGPGLDYLVDNQGNRLLVSGLWAVVRHPNYLGDLLCHLAFALPCGHRHLLPFYSMLLSTVFLVARTVSVESKCRQRYGDLWTRYTQRVKHRLVPYIF
ncbi:LOW QUALITY PROTEIN: delta(14)-sterol reductase TM7SF2-like [Amblyomma americanum]